MRAEPVAAPAAEPTKPATTGAATPLTFTLDLTGTTQFSLDSAANKVSQDGYAAGHLASLATGADGLRHRPLPEAELESGPP